MSQRNPEKVANALPWSERVNAISVNPYMATIADIARMAAELSEQESRCGGKNESCLTCWRKPCHIPNIPHDDKHICAWHKPQPQTGKGE